MRASCNSKIIAPPPCSIAGIFQKRLLFLPLFPSKNPLKSVRAETRTPKYSREQKLSIFLRLFEGEENE